MRRSPITLLALFAVLASACGDTDVANRGEETAPGQEMEDAGAEMDVEPVDIQAQRWFRDSGTLEFAGREWMIAGEPLYDPAVVRVGEYEDTPLYAEVNTAQPYSELYIPLENDYWQMVHPVQGSGTDTMTATSGAVPGIEPEGNPTGTDGGS